jgi:hypothetical protein
MEESPWENQKQLLQFPQSLDKPKTENAKNRKY